MITEEIQHVFLREEYRVLDKKTEAVRIFCKYRPEGLRVVILMDLEHGYSVSGEGQALLAEQIRRMFGGTQEISSGVPEGGFLNEEPGRRVEVLTLAVGHNMEQLRGICASGTNVWGYLTTERRLLIYENQPGDFGGLRYALETLERKPAGSWSVQGKKLPYITIGIVALNVIVYLILEGLGDTEDAGFIAAHGGMYPEFLVENGQWWRILTAGFIHYGAAHLINNMVVFAVLGQRLEQVTGHVSMAVIYLLSLIGGGLLSCAVMLYSGDCAVSAGASGAVFGVIGGIFWVILRHRGRFEGMTAKRYVFMLILSLYYGFSSVNIDNWAHIGGLVTGFIVTGIISSGKRAV